MLSGNRSGSSNVTRISTPELAMSCCHQHYAPSPDGDRGFEVDTTRVRFGRGLLDECGDAARALGMTRVALITDNVVGKLPFVATVRDSLRAVGIDVVT